MDIRQTPSNIHTWFFAFHPASRESLWTWMGHVDAFGVGSGGIWVWIYPERRNLAVKVSQGADGDILMAQALSQGEVLRFDKPSEFTLPVVALHSCTSVCGALVGIRAFTPRGLRRKLLQNGARIVNAEEQRDPRTEATDVAGTENG